MFKALANAHRVRMLQRLLAACGGRTTRVAGDGATSYCCATQAGADLGLAPSTVSHHLKELRQAGLVNVERRGRQIDCRVSDEALRLLASFFAGCCGGASRVAGAPEEGEKR